MTMQLALEIVDDQGTRKIFAIAACASETATDSRFMALTGMTGSGALASRSTSAAASATFQAPTPRAEPLKVCASPATASGAA